MAGRRQRAHSADQVYNALSSATSPYLACFYNVGDQRGSNGCFYNSCVVIRLSQRDVAQPGQRRWKFGFVLHHLRQRCNGRQVELSALHSARRSAHDGSS